jgi:hypothetical protein
MNLEQTDEELAKAINAYRKAHPFCSISDLRRNLKTSDLRMRRMRDLGLITLPAKMSRSISATLNRKRHGIGNNFVINHKTDIRLRG